jgi:hypothetical protein
MSRPPCAAHCAAEFLCPQQAVFSQTSPQAVQLSSSFERWQVIKALVIFGQKCLGVHFDAVKNCLGIAPLCKDGEVKEHYLIILVPGFGILLPVVGEVIDEATAYYVAAGSYDKMCCGNVADEILGGGKAVAACGAGVRSLDREVWTDSGFSGETHFKERLESIFMD